MEIAASLIGSLIGWCLSAAMFDYSFFWIFGTWLNPFVAFVGGLLPINFFVWLFLWILHFATITFPLVHH